MPPELEPPEPGPPPEAVLPPEAEPPSAAVLPPLPNLPPEPLAPDFPDWHAPVPRTPKTRKTPKTTLAVGPIAAKCPRFFIDHCTFAPDAGP